MLSIPSLPGLVANPRIVGVRQTRADTDESAVSMKIFNIILAVTAGKRTSVRRHLHYFGDRQEQHTPKLRPLPHVFHCRKRQLYSSKARPSQNSELTYLQLRRRRFHPCYPGILHVKMIDLENGSVIPYIPASPWGHVQPCLTM